MCAFGPYASCGRRAIQVNPDAQGILFQSRGKFVQFFAGRHSFRPQAGSFVARAGAYPHCGDGRMKSLEARNGSGNRRLPALLFL
jgi:hypothetical protein